MVETYYAGAYWGARQEPAEQCAQRARAFFLALAQCDDSFSRWSAPPRSRKAARRPFEPNEATLRELLAQSRNRNDEGGIIGDLGFHLSVENVLGQDSPQEDHSHLSLRCGVYAEPVGNACVLSLPSSGAHFEQVVSAPLLAKVIRAMALAWEPGWSIATSHEHRELSTNRAIVGTFVGWVMYFARSLGTVPPLPPPVRVESVEGKGTLVILTPERFTASNPDHVALAAHVQDTLHQAGLLRPLY